MPRDVPASESDHSRTRLSLLRDFPMIRLRLDNADIRHLKVAQGYVALGMYAEANSEIEEIDPACRTMTKVFAVRIDGADNPR